MDDEANHNGEEVEAQLGQLASQVPRLKNLAGDQEADANWCEVDDPGCQL